MFKSNTNIKYWGLLAVLLMVHPAFAQNCPSGTIQYTFPPNAFVQVIACKETKVILGKQSVYWGVKNLTGDKLYVSFDKVVTTTCGKVMRSKGDTYLKPGEMVSGTTFSGEMTFETQVWKEDCANMSNRISKIAYENLIVRNIADEDKKKSQATQSNEQTASASSPSGASPALPGPKGNRAKSANTNLPEKSINGYSGGASIPNPPSIISNPGDVQHTLDQNAPLNKAVADLVDKYLVDKDKLASNPLNAAAYDYTQKAFAAPNRQEQQTYMLTAGVLSLFALANEKLPQVLSDEQAQKLTADYNKKLDATRPYYLYAANKKISDLIEGLKDTSVNFVNRVSILARVKKLQQAQFDLLQSQTFVSKYDGKVELPDFQKILTDGEKTAGYATNIGWNAFSNQEVIFQNGKGVIITDPKEPKNVQQIGLLKHSWHRLFVCPQEGVREITSMKTIDGQYAAADDNFSQYKLADGFKLLQLIDAADYPVDRNNAEAVKNSYAATESFSNEKPDWKHRYFAGFTGLRKLSGMAMLGDVMADSAVAAKDLRGAGRALQQYAKAWKYFQDNLLTADSYNYNPNQYLILNSFFDNYIKTTALFVNYSVNEAANKRYTAVLEQQLLTYIAYVSFHMKGTTAP